MKKEIREKGNHSAPKIWKRMLAMTLSILMVTSVIDYSGFSNVSAQTLTQDSTKIIKDFAALSKDISNQQIAVGASETDIYLPDTLNVTVKPYVQEGAKTDANITEEFEDNDIQETEVQNNEVEQQKTLENITWKINATESDVNTFDSTSAGAVYIYEPVLPEGYTLADGVSMPEIQVKIEDNDRWVFSRSQTIDGIEITVKAEKDVFPEGAVLHAEKVTSAEDKEKIQSAVSEEVQAEDASKTVAELASFDITITDADGNELQPDTSKGEVKVSFAQLPMVTEDTAPTQELKVFHMDDSLSEAKGLDTTMDKAAETLEAPAEHFSVYTVAQLTEEIRANVEAEIKATDGTLTYYDTIEEAITAAQGMSGSTVTLLKDVATDNAVNITSGTFTLDLNGKAWTNTYSVGSGVLQLIGSSGNTVSLTVKDSVGGGSITTTDSGVYSIFGYTYYALSLEGGRYTGIWADANQVGDVLADGYAYKNNESDEWVTDMSDNTITNITVRAIPVAITVQPNDAVATPSYTEAEAPTFTVTAETIPKESGETIAYQWYKDSVAIDSATNASYTVEPNLGEGTYTYYCAVTCDGYTVNTENATLFVTSATGNYEVTASNGTSVSYPTLETAITAAKSKPNSIVKLLADTTTSDTVEVSSGTFIIDLNGKIWTSNASAAALNLTNGCHVTLMDSATGGKITTSTASLTIRTHHADLTIKSGIYENENDNSMSFVLAAYSSGTITIQGGTIQTSKSLMYLVYLQSVEVVISGGTFSGSVTAFENCDSVELSGGEYKYITTNDAGIVADLLASGYGYKNVSNSTWVNRLANPTDYANDLAHTFLQSPVIVERLPLEINNQPTAPESVVYGYSEAPQISMYVERTDYAPIGSTVTYQLWKVKSGEETYDSAVGEAAYNNHFTLPTGLDAGSYQYYIVAECDGCQLRSKTVTLTVEKSTPMISLELLVHDGDPFIYGNEIYFTATVTSTNGDYPDGTVTFMDGDDVLFADVTYSYYTYSHFYQKSSDDVPAGNHCFTAVYTPSADGTGKNYVGVTSTVVEQSIAKADQSISITEVDGKKYKDADFTLETTGGKGTGAVTFSVPEGNGVLSISQKEDGRFDAAIIGAGEVTVTATKAADTNYNEATATQSITIAKAAAPSIDFPTASSITYGQKLSASALSESSTEYGTFAWTDGSMVPTVTNSGYELTFTPKVSTVANYEEISNTTETVAITVTKATPAVTINADISGDAGSRKATLMVTVASVGDGETPTGTVKLIDRTNGSDVELEGATEVTITDGKAVYAWTGLADQIYKVKAVYSGSDNYNTATSTELSFDITKKNQEDLTIEDIGTKTYGDAAFVLTTTGGSGSGAFTFTSTDPKIVSVSGNVATIHKAGTVTITATKATDNTYLEATTSVSLKVEKKELTVRAEDKQNIIAGSSMPQLTYRVTGLVGSDTFTKPTILTTAVDTSTLGKYAIKISGGTLINAENYAVTYTNGTLTIVKASIEQAVIAGITDQKYTGKSLEQKKLSVQINGKTLIKDTDYTLAYKNNTNIGTATLTITGKGNYIGTIEKNFQINISKGATYTVSNMSYKVTNAKTNGKGSVTLVKSTKSKSKLKGTLKIGDTVTIGGKSFQITAVDAKAFKGYTKLTKVTIGNNVTTIGKEAFSGCSKLTTVTIGTGLKTISTNAFYKCKKLKTITISSKKLKTVGKNAIKSIYSKAAIKVPSSKVTAYKKLWKSSTGYTKKMSIKKK